MRKSLLPDETYDKEIERMSGLSKFPHVPVARQEIRSALRRISESDEDFIHRLISDVIDTHATCPTPAELIQLAGAKRARLHQSVGKRDCERCNGDGFISFTKRVKVAGVEYETEFAKVCTCRSRI